MYKLDPNYNTSTSDAHILGNFTIILANLASSADTSGVKVVCSDESWGLLFEVHISMLKMASHYNLVRPIDINR